MRESTRPLSNSERAELVRRARWEVNTDLGGAITFFVVLAVVGGALGSCAGKWMPHALPVSLAIAFLLWIAAARFNLRARIAEKAAFRRDLAKGEARVLHIEDAEVFVQAERGSEGPTVVMRVSDTRVLVLSGQWLLGGALYGVETEDGDDVDDARVNGLRDPHGFPSKDFELAFAPASRLVLGIRVLGSYAADHHRLPAGTVTLEDLSGFELLAADHPAVRKALSARA